MATAVTVVAVGTGAVGASDGSGKLRPRVPSTRTVERFTAWTLEHAVAGAGTAPAGCDAPQPDRKRFYLPVFAAPGEHELQCSVPEGRKLVVDLGGWLCAEAEDRPRDALVERCRGEYAESPNLVAAWVDGVESAVPAASATGTFDVTLAEGNPFDLPAGPRAFAFVSKDLELDGLEPGHHTIVTYHRIVPGPGEPFDVTMRFELEVR